MVFHVPEQFRMTDDRLQHAHSVGISTNNGTFLVPCFLERKSITLRCIASDGFGWEHVSVSLSKNRLPIWEEMCFVKDIFWDEDDCVLQYHPPKEDYVNCHPYVLHLWRPVGGNIPRPPSEMVGQKGITISRRSL